MINVSWSSPEAEPRMSAGDALRQYQQDRQVLSAEPPRPTPVLMSADNPKGWKLEELLERVRVELMAKNAKLAASAGHGLDPAEMRRAMIRTTVRELNERLVALVMQATLVQHDILAELNKLGPDPGPLGKARV